MQPRPRFRFVASMNEWPESREHDRGYMDPNLNSPPVGACRRSPGPTLFPCRSAFFRNLGTGLKRKFPGQEITKNAFLYASCAPKSSKIIN